MSIYRAMISFLICITLIGIYSAVGLAESRTKSWYRSDLPWLFDWGNDVIDESEAKEFQKALKQDNTVFVGLCQTMLWRLAYYDLPEFGKLDNR
jgi:hypothetical protein